MIVNTKVVYALVLPAPSTDSVHSRGDE